MSCNIMVGNVGSGKSLLASKFAKSGAAVVNNDSLVRMIGGGEYNLYDYGKKEVYKSAEESTIESALIAGIDVVIDRTNMDSKRRARYIALAKKHTDQIICYDFGPGDELGLKRRKKASQGVPPETWEQVHNRMRESYNQPNLSEGFSDIIVAPKKYTFHAIDFDGTIVENRFPDIGEIKTGKVDELNELWKDLANIIIIWTCRSGEHADRMRKFLCDKKIPFDFINENPVCDFGGRKIFAHSYDDDRNTKES